MDDDRKQAIARRAYELWEQSDRTHGRHDEHWRKAEEEFAAAPDRHGIANVTGAHEAEDPPPKAETKPAAA